MALHAFIERLPAGTAAQTVEIGDWPLYDADVQAKGFPDKVQAAQKAMVEADGIVLASPEYNYGPSGVLKNAIDWLSRPFGDGALKGKPLAVIGAAMGRYGGVWAHDETRKSFGLAGPRVIEEIKLSVPIGTLDGRHPREHAQLVADVRDVVAKLAGEAG
jgi:NAD(P)H-dependent FMN reductase